MIANISLSWISFCSTGVRDLEKKATGCHFSSSEDTWDRTAPVAKSELSASMRKGLDGSGYCQRAVHGRSRRVGLSVRDMESLVCCAVLVYPDRETEPGFRVCIRRPSEHHPCEGCRDSVVKASAELDYDGFRVSVSGIVDKVAELVEIVVDRPFALEVGGRL